MGAIAEAGVVRGGFLEEVTLYEERRYIQHCCCIIN